MTYSAQQPSSITSTEIPNSERLNALPGYFGKSMMKVEGAIYHYMTHLCSDYDGGYWSFYALSNGGFYMAPLSEEKQHIEWADNYFKGDMTADAAGIVACLFTYSHLSETTSENETLVNRFHQLREYALDHPEAGLIFQAIN